MAHPHWGICIGLLLFASEAGLNIARRARGSAVVRDQQTLGFIWAINLAGIGGLFFFLFQFHHFVFPAQKTVADFGLGIFIFGLLLRWWAVIHLGRFFTVNVAIAADHRLIDNGPYRWLRHPSYTGSVLTIVGLGLVLGNIGGFCCLLVACLIGCARRIKVEEAALASALGEPYQNYMKRTWRLVPWIY